GQAGENNGVLLLVARDDRKMRIEVGYGLEGTLTDLHTKLIIENDMVPAFRAGDFAGGITKAVDDMIMVLEGHPEELEARAARNQQEKIGRASCRERVKTAGAAESSRRRHTRFSRDWSSDVALPIWLRAGRHADGSAYQAHHRERHGAGVPCRRFRGRNHQGRG